MPDVTLAVSPTQATPLDYPIPGAAELLFKLIAAQFTSTGAAYVPAIQLVVGGSVIASFPLGQTVAAGASADVAWFPGVSGGGGASGATSQIQLPLDTPDINGNAFAELTTRNGFATVRRILPTFSPSLDGSWSGSLAIPNNYGSGATLICFWVADATTGNLRHAVASSVVAAGSSEDAAYTTEAYLNTTVPGTVNTLFKTTFVLSTTGQAGAHLNVQVLRNGSNVLDTLAANAQLLALMFQYTSS